MNLQQWPQAIDDYAHVITPETTDTLLLSNRATNVYEALRHWDAAAADWSRAAAEDPEGATWLAEFARRLVAGGQVPLAKDQYEKAVELQLQILQQRTDDCKAWKDLGILGVELGLPESAATAFAKSLELTPESGKAKLWWSPHPFGIGEALANHDEIFARVVQMRPRDRTLLIARCHYLGLRRAGGRRPTSWRGSSSSTPPTPQPGITTALSCITSAISTDTGGNGVRRSWSAAASAGSKGPLTRA